MNLYSAIYAVIFLGVGAIILQQNLIGGIVFLLLAPIPIIILSVLTNILLSKFTRELKWVDNENRHKDGAIAITKTLEESEVIFHRLTYHDELFIENASPEQIVNFLKDSTASSLWYLHIANKIAYDVNYARSRFYDPKNDKAVVHGCVFSGIEWELEQRENGILNRVKERRKIPNMFTISIVPAGLESKVKLQIRFDTQIKDVFGFFEMMKGELRRMFDIKGPDWWIS